MLGIPGPQAAQSWPQALAGRKGRSNVLVVTGKILSLMAKPVF